MWTAAACRVSRAGHWQERIVAALSPVSHRIPLFETLDNLIAGLA